MNATSIRSACGNTDDTLENVFNKKSSLRQYSDIVPEKTVCIGKLPSDLSFRSFLIESVNEVLVISNLDDFSNTLLLVGSSVGGMATTERVVFTEKDYKNIDTNKHTIDAIASTLNQEYNFLSTRSFSTACTSSANALKVAKELIAVGAYENILVVGADEICSTTIFGFSALGVLNDDICTPFQNGRKGMNVAEGIGVLLLQNIQEKDSIQFMGAGCSSDAFHIANPDPTADGAKSAMLKALDDASLEVHQINYINAHGTGTHANDSMEAKAILELFGKNIFISSSKSNFGHTLGAAGAIEAIVCIEALRKNLLPPQIKSDDNEVDLNFLQESISINVKYVLSNSFAFGGNNTALIFGFPNEH